MSKNAHFRLPPGSTIKLALALVFARSGVDPEAHVAVQSDDMVRGSTMGLRPGDIVSGGDLLHGLLMASGNDAAHTLGRLVGEPVEKMNDLASSLGMTRTRFVNPSGLDMEGQYTTAHDLALLACEAFSLSMIRAIAGTVTHAIDFKGAHPRRETIASTVTMLGERGVIAGKTGSTRRSRGCLALLFQSPGRRVVMALLGSSVRFDRLDRPIPATDQRFEDARKILGAV